MTDDTLLHGYKFDSWMKHNVQNNGKSFDFTQFLSMKKRMRVVVVDKNEDLFCVCLSKEEEKNRQWLFVTRLKAIA